MESVPKGCDRVAVLLHADGRTRRYPLPRGATPKYAYTIDGERWVLLMTLGRSEVVVFRNPLTKSAAGRGRGTPRA
jgi:hypothetical protein